MTKEQKALARLDNAKAELRAAQAEVDAHRYAWAARSGLWGLREEAFRQAVAA